MNLNDKMIAEFRALVYDYNLMDLYYKGDHDINRLYNKFPNRSNQIVIDNFINKFINEEIGYSLGNPLSMVSMSGNKQMIDDIYKTTFHWKDNHDQKLMRTLEIFGKAYILNYIDGKGRFSEKVLSPKNAIIYCDDDGVPVRFIHFYKPKYRTEEYHDIYYPDGRIEIYKGNVFQHIKQQPFAGIPVSVCELDNIEDTIYFKIKHLQDAYNEILSDQVNTISDYRRAYLVISGVMVDEEMEKKLKTHGLLNLQSAQNASVKWLVKDMPDGYIQNTLERLRAAMYETCNHIDGNEKLQSNTSGTALRNRLVFLEQRCNSILDVVLNTVYDRTERLLEYLNAKGKTYDFTDIKIVATPCIPQDEISIIQGLSQLGIGTNISLETALSRLPFVENPAQEIAKIKQEQKTNNKIELDKIDLVDDSAESGDAA